ncbi:MAG: glycosyltransferase, partial [Rhodopila sp.]
FNGNPNDWLESVGGDGGLSGFDAANPTNRFHTYFSAQADINFAGGDPTKWLWIADPLRNSGEGVRFYMPIIADPRPDRGGSMFAGLQWIWRTTDNGGDPTFLANNCNDDTAAIARGLTPSYHLEIIEIDIPSEQAGPGFARRLAMRRAAKRAGDGGILLTSDADGAVPPDWVQRNLAALLDGADLVCGQSLVEVVEAEFVPQHLHDDDVLERRLAALIDEMAWIVDPDPADPLPRHQENSGASLGVWVSAWRRASGIPPVHTAEDRAFVAALRRVDAWIRHDPGIFVTVSGRVIGRAAGGMADAIRRRIVQQDEFTDETLEPPADARRRLTLRARARSVWERPRPDKALAAQLGIDPARLEQALLRPFFGAAWEEMEAHSVLATRRRVRFADLPQHIEVAEMLLASLENPDSLAAD